MRRPAGSDLGTVTTMGAGPWVILGTAVVVLVLITLYVASMRR
ncbi:hypothetical protein [Dactylosporangium sp. NPDC000521]